MAQRTYRFRSVGSVDVTRLESWVGASVTLVDNVGGRIVDLKVEEAQADDLKEKLSDDGFEFVEVDPTTPPARDFLGNRPTTVLINNFGNVLTRCSVGAPGIDDILTSDGDF